MKAILVIDIDYDDVNFEECNSTVYVEFPFAGSEWIKRYSDVSIRPMPQKVKSVFEYGSDIEYVKRLKNFHDSIIGETE